MAVQFLRERVERDGGAVTGEHHLGVGRSVADSKSELMQEEGGAAELSEFVLGGSLARRSVWLIIATVVAVGSAATAEAVHEVVICALVAGFTAIGAAFSLRAGLYHLRS